MSLPSDPVHSQLAFLFRHQAYREAADLLDRLPKPDDFALQAERRRLRGWARLAIGDTEQAYDLFWRCADHQGARAGILILTIIAGQVSAAMNHWQRFCQTLRQPLLELPDAYWHARPVALAALQQLDRYPFARSSSERGAAGLYSALLHRALGDAPGAFLALAAVSDFYPPADLLRDRWLEEVVCLPAPRGHSSPSPGPPPGKLESRQELARMDSEVIVRSAARLLLYPDVPTLERLCREALDEARWTDALEILRRLLLLDPNHKPSLEKRWRLHLQLGSPEAAKADLFALVDLYENCAEIVACQALAQSMLAHFPDDERALLKMCFLQARLGSPLALAHYGRQLLELCRDAELHDHYSSYRNWLLRQKLSLDDRSEFESRTTS